MSIRRGPLAADNFTLVPHAWSRSPGLSLKAKGLLLYIAGHAAGYELTVAQIVRESADGKESVENGIRELVKAGYLKRTRVRNPDGTLGAYDYELVDYLPGVSAGQDQSGFAHHGESRTGADQPQQDVSAGGNQSGLTTVVNPPTKKNTPKKTREEDQGSAPETGAPEPEQQPEPDKPPEPNAGSIVGDFIDYCGEQGVRLTPQAIARYGRKIKELLTAGFPEKLIKHALARQLQRGQASRPGLLDNFVIEVQGGGQPAPQQRPAYQTAAEKTQAKNDREAGIARVFDQMAAAEGLDLNNWAAVREMQSRAALVYDDRLQLETKSVTNRQVVGYTDGRTIEGSYQEVTHAA